jgi:DNA-binding HxlR family transcriptional regulator
MLIVRDAAAGKTRFSEFSDSLGVSTDVLTDRLATLVTAGVLERRSYRSDGARKRFSYHLTEIGVDLNTVLAALTAWGDKHLPTEAGPSTFYRELASRRPVTVQFLSEDGEILEPAAVEVAPITRD